MKYPFSFEAVGFYAEDRKYYKQCGMGVCANYSDAAAQIEDYFGAELIKIDKIKLYEESNLIFLPREMIRKYDRADAPSIDFEIPLDVNGLEFTEVEKNVLD